MFVCHVSQYVTAAGDMHTVTSASYILLTVASPMSYIIFIVMNIHTNKAVSVCVDDEYLVAAVRGRTASAIILDEHHILSMQLPSITSRNGIYFEQRMKMATTEWGEQLPQFRRLLPYKLMQNSSHGRSKFDCNPQDKLIQTFFCYGLIQSI